MVRRSLAGLAAAVPPGGYLIYTNQPWHPQLELIARAADQPSRQGQAWIMRRRTQAEMDQLVAAAGFRKLEQRIDEWGIFTVSLAERVEARLEPRAARAVDRGRTGGAAVAPRRRLALPARAVLLRQLRRGELARGAARPCRRDRLRLGTFDPVRAVDDRAVLVDRRLLLRCRCSSARAERNSIRMRFGC